MNRKTYRQIPYYGHPSFYYPHSYPGLIAANPCVYPYSITRQTYPHKGINGDDRPIIEGILASAGAEGEVSKAVTKVKDVLAMYNPPWSGIFQIHNFTNTTLRKVKESTQLGSWAITPTREIPPHSTLVFGVKGFIGSIPEINREGSITYAGDGIELTVYWNIPYVGSNSCNIILTGPKAAQYITYKACESGNQNVQMRYELRRRQVDYRYIK